MEEFSKKFSPFRNVKSMPDYDAYNLLSNNNLLKNKFELTKCFPDNYTIYSYELQKRFCRVRKFKKYCNQQQEINFYRFPRKYLCVCYECISFWRVVGI